MDRKMAVDIIIAECICYGRLSLYLTCHDCPIYDECSRGSGILDDEIGIAKDFLLEEKQKMVRK